MAHLYLTYDNALLYYIVAKGGNLFTLTDSPYRFILYSVLVISFVYLIVMSQTRRLIKTRKLLREKEQALEMIERQKVELEMKDRDITDSLKYAQRIQEALLPSEAYFRHYFEDSFIFFKPRDIVSGDFYWMGEMGGKVFVIAADCTGHGVPGALMSMIGIEIFEKTIKESSNEKPSQILKVLNDELEQVFNRGKNVAPLIKDSMDVGLCIIDKKKKVIDYAGAFIPLYLIRENSLIEFKGDKIMIGMNPEGLPYTDHKINFKEDDMFYMFSDGYVDQFGGSQNRKFMYRRFRHLLLTIHRFFVDDQKSILEENIKTWMGENIQVDDIMVIGFKPLNNQINSKYTPLSFQ